MALQPLPRRILVNGGWLRWRSVLIFTHEEYQQLYGVPGAFETIVKHYLEIGITEICFLYPFVPMLMPMFEQIANEAIPRLREFAREEVVMPPNTASIPQA